MLLRYTHSLKHHVLFRSQKIEGNRPSGTPSNAQAFSVHYNDFDMYSRCSTQPAERTPEPSPCCFCRYSSGVGEHRQQRDELYEAQGVERGCDRLLTSLQYPSSTRIVLFACMPCPLLETPRVLGLPHCNSATHNLMVQQEQHYKLLGSTYGTLGICFVYFVYR